MKLPLIAAEAHLPGLVRPLAKGISSPSPNRCLGTRTGVGHQFNQDRVLFARFVDAARESVDLCLLCDGMGGMAEGERCAELAASSFLATLATSIWSGRSCRAAIQEAVDIANLRLHEEFGGKGGTTLASIVVRRGIAMACCVGDSRIFSVRPDGLRQLSRDDTVRGALDAYGLVRQDGTLRIPEHERLVQYLGIGIDLVPHIFDIEISGQDRFLLVCSDGAYRPPGEMLSKIAVGASTPRQITERLLAISEWLGGTDDASVLAVSLASDVGTAREECEGGTIRIWGPSQTGVLIVIGSDTGAIENTSRGTAEPMAKLKTSGRDSRRVRDTKKKHRKESPPQSPSEFGAELVIEVTRAIDKPDSPPLASNDRGSEMTAVSADRSEKP